MKFPIRVLFVCTGNACRSQMAQAMLRHIGGDRFEVESAGTHPAGFIHELAVASLEAMQIHLVNQHSKSLGELKDRSFDLIVTLCDSAACEAIPPFPGDPVKVHWGLPDPVSLLGDEEERLDFAFRIAARLRAKVEGLTAMDWSAHRDEIRQRLDFLGDI